MSSSTPTTFADIIPITQSTPNTYTLSLSDAFCVGAVPNGGYITSAFLLCARTHMQLTHPTLPSSDPINLHLEFLRRTATGPATFTVKDVKLGSRISNLHLTLRQHRDPADPTDPVQDEVEGYVMLSSLATETGPSQDTGYTLHPPRLPADLAKLATNADDTYTLRRPDPYGSFRRATLHCEMYLVRPDRRTPGASPAVVDQWVRFRPLAPARDLVADLKNRAVKKGPGRWTNDSLGYVVDIFPQLNERFLNERVEDALLTGPGEVSDEEIHDLVRGGRGHRSTAGGAPARTFWYPTLLLNLDVKKSLPDAGAEWLFVRVRAKAIRKGRFDVDVEVWDVGGELVALSTHAALVLDAGRNMARDGKEKGKGKGRGSKI